MKKKYLKSTTSLRSFGGHSYFRHGYDGVKAPSLITGFTLIEITVSTILIALMLIGLVNLFVGGKRYILHSRSRMAGGELGRVFLEPLQMQVRQDTWNQTTNGLSTGTRNCQADADPPLPNCPPEGERTLYGMRYDAEYNISDDSTGGPLQNTDLRRVVLTISWTEPQP